ncbi:hypothetical protein ACQY0O_002134 [Thecaphora frezii]
MTSQQQLIPHIHHERQEPGSMLCAQHALNALLQGNYYDATQLADIARELDSLESTQLGLSAADIASRDRASLNMDDTGFFSVSVLERALQVWGLSLANWRSEAMRPRQAAPEKERAFVLNLDSHWFTIRSFGSSGQFWYNLNSFLPQPSWVGPNYLGTLLHTAESEGYSVFVAFAGEGTLSSSLSESDADQVADLLPKPGSAAASSSNTSNAALGLKPQMPSASSSADRGLSYTGDEDADLQAALRASLADSAAVSSPSSLASAPRLRRGRSGSGSNSVEGFEVPETDADIDMIAPMRQRMRSGLTSGPSMKSTTTSFIDEEEELRRAMEASLATTSSSSSLAATAANARSASSTTAGDERQMNRRRRRIQRPQAGGTTAEDAIDIDAADASLTAGSLPTRSPFLSPAMAAANADNDDVEDLPSDDDDLDPFSVPGAPEASALIGRQDRDYDDEDQQLQAALAASLGDEGAAARLASMGAAVTGSHSQSKQDVEPTPPDVDRIRKMREEQRRVEREERDRQERRQRGEVTPPPPSAAAAKTKAKSRGDGENEDDDDEEEEEAEEISPEEMRRRRLARFG